ncbi:hypothetical protein DQP58_00070 [Mycobacterium colombiense]|uniref:Uncharacterized protein n=1 Tax=Mycobacterium colombiense TaxID=339268 RepID=A0A329KZ44_9MYCO|nr:hypothetical protein [Mycobacterium colombiense]RAV00671.1 hypothetical protein DQP58_00070 [Mycobacterium colombiense]
MIVGNGYANTALEDESAILARTKPGGRNYRLNLSAFNLGQLVGAGMLDQREVEDALIQACKINRHYQDDGESMVLGSIKSGLEAGKAKPRTIKRRLK